MAPELPPALRTTSVRAARLVPTRHLDEAPERHRRPHPLEQEEAPLGIHVGEHAQDRGADEVEHQVGAGVLVETSELGRSEGREDEERARHLYHLIHAARVVAGV